MPCLWQSSHRATGKGTWGDAAGDGTTPARGSSGGVWAGCGCLHRRSQPHKASLSPETFPVFHVTPAPGGGSWEAFDVPEPFPFPARTRRLRARGIKNPLSTQLRPHPHGDLLSLTGPTGRWEGARESQSSHAARVGELPPAPTQRCLCVPGGSRSFSLTRVGLPPFPSSRGGQRRDFLPGCWG